MYYLYAGRCWKPARGHRHSHGIFYRTKVSDTCHVKAALLHSGHGLEGLRRLVDNVGAVAQCVRYLVDRLWLEYHYEIRQIQRAACAGVSAEVAIDVGTGQYHDEWPIWIGRTKRTYGTSVLARVECHQTIGRLAVPPLLHVRSVADLSEQPCPTDRRDLVAGRCSGGPRRNRDSN